MSTVTLSIGPKSYTVACADGQEAHIRALGAMIAEKYAQLGSARAPLEAQNLLFAALFMADELAEARKHVAHDADTAPDTSALDTLRKDVARLEAELEVARKAAATAPDPALPLAAKAPQTDLFGGAAPVDSGANLLAETIAERLEALAARAEVNAAALEEAAANA